MANFFRPVALMGWFQKICRNVGLAIHNVQHPDGAPKTDTHEINRTVEEEDRGDITLRRTTIEEVEIKRPPTRDSDARAD